MEISGKGLLHFYQETSSLMGSQAYHRTNMLLPYESNSRYESNYECICIAIYGKTRSVPLNNFSSVVTSLNLLLIHDLKLKISSVHYIADLTFVLMFLLTLISKQKFEHQFFINHHREILQMWKIPKGKLKISFSFFSTT